jgi:hypothetical protein
MTEQLTVSDAELTKEEMDTLMFLLHLRMRTQRAGRHKKAPTKL